jgi:Lon-like ATP-dependent protease
MDSIYNVGSFCEPTFDRFDKSITLKPKNRVELLEVLEPPSTDIPFPLVKVRHYEDGLSMATSEEDQTILRLLIQRFEELRKLLSPHEITTLELFAQRYNMKVDEHLLNYVGVVLSYMCDTAKVQNIFEPEDFSERLKRTAELAQEHVQMRNAMKQLHEEAQEKIAKMSEEHVYKEILSLIKSKLGMDKDEKETLRQKYFKNLEGKKVPEHIQKIIDEEMERLMMTEKNASEFHVIRTYLDWLTSLPYGVFTEEILDLKKAKEILDRDHYGMKDVKERILEFIAVSKLKGSSTGKILCFVGPPGVGKTSIARSIAEAINRKYHRISLGGLDDVSELKGHRRTYVGAQPGKIITALKQAGSENPVILIDEIDKVGKRSLHGSPENALLEILDPQQNSNFNDHYMDTQIDLSKVLFICTANFLENINPILVDRMEVITLQGYTTDEKKHIMDKHLMPKALERVAVTKEQFDITPEAQQNLIRDYAREAGVRSLERNINKILEKVAVKVVRGETHTQINDSNLKDFVGYPPFSSKKMYEETPSGVVTGLAYTIMGGSTLYIEVSKATFKEEEKKSAGLKMTGNLKKVMEESIQIAYTYSRKFAAERNNDYLDTTKIHIHVPEGATPKDGPSAGITMTTALLSLAFDTPVIPHLAMTGEISLKGKVLAIGGLKEKIVAAKREGIKTVILPHLNRHTWQELPEELRDGLAVHFVKEYDEVFKIAFPNLK